MTSEGYPELETPALLVDLDVLERNIEGMARLAAEAGVRLRPHIKTHKCPEIAQMQIDAGASGITCAKLSEAEIMVDAGADDVLVAYPIWGERKVGRLQALRERAHVRVDLDTVEVAEALGPVGLVGGNPLEVLVEVDTGHGRCGRPAGVPTFDLVRDVRRVPGLEVIGLLTHAGHAYRARSADELRAIAEREAADLVETAELCRKGGIELREISVGSTPTARIGAGVPGVTEIRPGTYVFNDAAMIRLGVASEQTTAVRILATVVSRPNEERFVIDAGTKCFTSDGMGTVRDWIVVAGRPGLHMEFLTEEHGVGRQSSEERVEIGERLESIPSHACTAVNMFDVAYGVRDGKVVRELEIAGRGKVV